MEITELIEKAQQNDVAAIEELYNQFYPIGISFALQFVKNEQDAMDIIQEVFISVFNKLNTLEDTTKFKSWYMQIVANKCRDFLKKKNPLSFTDANMYNEEGELQFEEADDDREFQPEESVDYSETKRIVEEMLNDLPEEQKMCLLLFYVNDMKISEIAQALRISQSTVKSRLKYGKDKLRVSVNEYEEKNGVKLHGVGGVSIIPLLRFLFTKGAATPKLPILPFANISAQIGAASAAAATTAATATATVGGIKGIIATFGTVKAIAISAAAVVVATGIIGGSVLINNDSKINDNQQQINSNVSPDISYKQLQIMNVDFGIADKIVSTSNNIIVCGQPTGETHPSGFDVCKYGVIDLNGDIVLPFEYSWIKITDDGHIILESETICDSRGKEIFTSDKIGNNEAIYDYYDGTVITTSREKYGVYGDDVHLKKLDGSLIKTYKNAKDFTNFINGKMILIFDPDNVKENFVTIDNNGNILHSLRVEDADSLITGPVGTVGYFRGGYMALCPNYSDSAEYYLINETLDEFYKIYLDADLNNGIEYSYDIMDFYHGKNLALYSSDKDKCFLAIATNETKNGWKPITEAKYDWITFTEIRGNAIKYARVGYGDKVGYLSLDGKTEKFFDEATEFINGKALVKENGKWHVINEDFEKISNEIELNAYITMGAIGDGIFTEATKGRAGIFFYPINNYSQEYIVYKPQQIEE